jgi:hypothetical protein
MFSDYSASRKEYYTRAIFPQNVQAFLQYDNNVCIPSNRSIKFKKLPWGVTEKEMMRACGSSRYVHNTETRGCKYAIHFYKEKLDNTKVLVQVHFINNRFFYASYTLKESDRKERKLIKTTIINKYGGDNIDSLLDSLVFKDENNNKAIITDSVYMNLGYFSGDFEARTILNKFCSEYTAEKRSPYQEKANKIYSLL